MTKTIFFVAVAMHLNLLCFGQKHKTSITVKANTEITVLLSKHGCQSCHHSEKRIVGPSFNAISEKNYSNEQILALVKNPNVKNWPGYPEMPKLENLPDRDLLKIAEWINSRR
jgi:cytochrome c551/c552